MTMQVTVRFFATLRDRAAIEQAQLDLQHGSTVGALLERLNAEYPEIGPLLPTALVAVNEEYAFPEDALHDGDEVALFPPVSGGEGWPEYFAVTADPLDIDAIIAAITRPETGGVCIFTGTVRGLTAGETGPLKTDHLVYEAYERMAEKKLRQVAGEIRARFPKVQGVAIVQRTGRLEVGETTVLVACAAGHRHDGVFEAARFGIDRLKEIVPVWKKEVGPDGSAWVEGYYHPTRADIDDAPPSPP